MIANIMPATAIKPIPSSSKNQIEKTEPDIIFLLSFYIAASSAARQASPAQSAAFAQKSSLYLADHRF